MFCLYWACLKLFGLSSFKDLYSLFYSFSSVASLISHFYKHGGGPETLQNAKDAAKGIDKALNHELISAAVAKYIDDTNKFLRQCNPTPKPVRRKDGRWDITFEEQPGTNGCGRLAVVRVQPDIVDGSMKAFLSTFFERKMA